MKVLKCHKCRYVWLYTGQSATHCICPASPCRTTVRFTRQEVPIRWDLTPAAVPTLPPTDLGGVAYPFIDVYDRAASIGIQVYSDDGLNTRTLYIPPDLQEDLGIPDPALYAAVLAAGGDMVVSGRYPIPPPLLEKIRPAFEA
jgi:hypothetical protein